MSGYDNEYRSKWDYLDRDHNCGRWYDERSRWRVGTFAQSLQRRQEGRHEDRLAAETEAYLRGIAECPTQDPGRGDPGE